MKILAFFKKGWNFLNSKTGRPIRNIAVVIILIAIILIQGCRVNKFKEEAQHAKDEKTRIENNYDAANDTIEQYQLDENTWVAEKKGFELTIDELETEYDSLFGEYQYEKNKPPKTVIHTVYEIVEKIDTVFSYAEVNGDTIEINFSDSARYSKYDYRNITGVAKSKYSIDDSTLTLSKPDVSIDFSQSVGIRTYLLKDKETSEISIVTETDYPNLTFTKIDGANILEDPKSKEAARSLRKRFQIGLNLGYGVVYSNSVLTLGPYFGVGISWSPKLLQFGR